MTRHKLALSLLLILFGCALPPPVPPTPVRIKTAYVYYVPIVVAPAVPAKGIAGYHSDGRDNYVWQAIGIGPHYNWNHLCTAAELDAAGRFPCVHSVRSRQGQTYWLYDDDGCGSYSQPELQACITAKAARWPNAQWLIGNEPDGADPAYSDRMPAAEAADRYGQIFNAIRAGAPQAAVSCCGFVLPLNLTTYADEFAAAWQQRWGAPFATVGGFHFHIYSIIGSGCAATDDACLQAFFDTQLSAGIGWAQKRGFGRTMVTEFGWTPFDSQQSVTLNAERIPGMCASLSGSSVDAYMIYHAPYPSPFALLNGPAAYPIGPDALNAAGVAYKGC